LFNLAHNGHADCDFHTKSGLQLTYRSVYKNRRPLRVVFMTKSNSEVTLLLSASAFHLQSQKVLSAAKGWSGIILPPKERPLPNDQLKQKRPLLNHSNRQHLSLSPGCWQSCFHMIWSGILIIPLDLQQIRLLNWILWCINTL